MQLNFFAHFTVHTWQTSVCKKGGDKALRMNFESKPGEDSLRGPMHRAVAATPVCQWVLGHLHHQIPASSESHYPEAEKASS